MQSTMIAVCYRVSVWMTRSQSRRPTHRMARTLGGCHQRNDMNAYVEEHRKINHNGRSTMGCDMRSTRDFGGGRNRTSSFLNSVFHQRERGWQEYFDHRSLLYQTNWNGWGRVCNWTGMRHRQCMCTWAGDHSDSPNIWQDNLRQGQRLTLFIRASMRRKTERLPTDFQIHRTNCRPSITRWRERVGHGDPKKVRRTR